MSAVVSFLTGALTFVVLVAVGIIVWRSLVTHRFPLFLFIYLTLPVGQLLMLYSFSFEEWSVYWLLGLLLGLAANALLLVFTISQEKKTETLEELRETRHRIELEKSHYESVVRRMEELDKIRKDFNDKLQSVAMLAHTGDIKRVQDSISSLAEKIDRTRENLYCNIAVINAVLTEKEKECEREGIILSVDLILPDRLGVESMHLCSIFSNILDNGIDACRKLKKGGWHMESLPDSNESHETNDEKDEKDEKDIQSTKYETLYERHSLSIRLSSIIDGDYLIIKAVNPSLPPLGAAPGRGYGSRILSDLAARYDGDYIGGYENGSYTVLISVIANR